MTSSQTDQAAVLTETGESYRLLGKELEAAEIPNALIEWAEANGSVLIDANTGHPRRAMDKRIRHELNEAVKKEIFYNPPQGTVRARTLMLRFFRQHNEPPVAGGEEMIIPLGIENAVVTANGTEAFAALTQNLAGKDGIVGLPKGYYSAYMLAIRHNGSNPVVIPADSENNFYPSRDELIAFYEANPKVKMVYLPSGNPTGCPCTARQAVEMAEGINEITRRSGGSVTFVTDDAYIGLSKHEEAAIFPLLDEAAQRKMVFMLTGSKILSLTSMCGGVISDDRDLVRSITGQRRVNALSSPPLGEIVFCAGLEILIQEHAEAVMKGIPPNEYGLIGKLAKSYLTELTYVENGLKALEESYGLSPAIVDHPTEKALYCLGNFSALLGREVPDLPLADGIASLREYLGTDRMRDDKDIQKLFSALTFMKPGAHGIDCRPGSIFGNDGYMRLTCTGDRKQHEQLLSAVKDCFDLFGIEQQKPFTYIRDQQKAERQQRQREVA